MAEEVETAITPIDSESDEEDEDYDVIDTSSRSKGLVQQVLTLDLSRQPTYTQALVGGATGWMSGFALSRVGKALAFALGGSLLLVHVLSFMFMSHSLIYAGNTLITVFDMPIVHCLIVSEMGNKAGYITVDWERLDKDMKEAQSNINKRFSNRRQKRAAKTFMKQGTKFVTRNMIALGGFFGGFFLGMAS